MRQEKDSAVICITTAQSNLQLQSPAECSTCSFLFFLWSRAFRSMFAITYCGRLMENKADPGKVEALGRSLFCWCLGGYILLLLFISMLCFLLLHSNTFTFYIYMMKLQSFISATTGIFLPLQQQSGMAVKDYIDKNKTNINIKY